MKAISRMYFAYSRERLPSVFQRCSWSLALVLILGCSNGWQDATALLDELSCGMSEEEVMTLLASLNHNTHWDSSSDGRLHEVTVRRGPNLSFYFSPDGLYAVRASETVAPMKVFSHPRRNLCTGERTIRVTVLAAGEAWKGSDILIDGQVAGELTDTPVPSAKLELPLGDHEVRLQTPDALSPAADLVLTPESSHVTVVFDAGDDPPQITTAPTEMWWRPHSL